MFLKKKKKKSTAIKKKKQKNMTKKPSFLFTINNSNGCLYSILNTCVLDYILSLRNTILKREADTGTWKEHFNLC